VSAIIRQLLVSNARESRGASGKIASASNILIRRIL